MSGISAIYSLVPYKLTNDYLFKALLLQNKTVLKALISALLHLPPEQVEDADVKNPMLPGDRITNKTVILDVNVLFNNGSRINLEMQVVNEHNWPERSKIAEKDEAFIKQQEALAEKDEEIAKLKAMLARTN